MAHQIKFYYAPGACSMAGQILLADSGLQHEEVAISGPEAKAEYTKNVNPKGQVPALLLDGQIITEAPAIVTAISQLVPDKHYTGKTPLETVRFYEWINYLSGTVHGKAYGAIFGPANFTTDEAAHDAIKAKGVANVLAGFKVIEEKLAALGGPKHALGNSLTGVDAYLTVYYLWAKKKEFDLSPFPNYTKLFESISQSEPFKVMIPKQG